MSRAGAMAAVATMLLLSGCGDKAMERTITEQQAYDMVENYVREAVTALPSEARLEITSPADSLECDDPTDHGPKGRVTIGTVYWVRDIVDDNKHFDAMLDWWTAHNFGVLADYRPKKSYIWVENRDDGFRMALRVNPKGDLLLGADSPCVWPNGTP